MMLSDKSDKLNRKKYFSRTYGKQIGKRFFNLRKTFKKFDVDMQSTIEIVIKTTLFLKNIQ